MNSKVKQERSSRKAETASPTALNQNFLANISHEFHTPVNGILGMTEILLNTELSEDQLNYIKMIHQSAQNILYNIDQIISHTHLENNDLKVDYQKFDLKDETHGVINLMKPSTETKNLKLMINVDENCPAEITGDALKLRQILTNLIGNAIKFTEEGYICLQVNLVLRRDNTAQIEFTVEDSGIGMSDEELTELHKAFKKGESLSFEQSQGLGLGLSITNKLVELLGGNLTIESEANKGTSVSFSITFPIDKHTKAIKEYNEEDLDDTPTVHAMPNKNSFPAKVLLVEDNEVNKHVAKNVLELLGCKVTAVENGAQAIQAIEISEFDIVFMDCHMPVMDGIEATKHIREKEQGTNQHLTIVALTANIVKENKDEYFQVGMDDYLCKPFGVDDMQQILEKWLKHKQLVSEKVAREAAFDLFDHELFDALISIHHPDRSSLGEEVIDIYITEADRLLAIVNEKSRTHIDKHCFEALDKLRTSSQSIGALKMSQLYQDFYKAAVNQDKFLQQELLEQLNKHHNKLKTQAQQYLNHHGLQLPEHAVS